MKKIGYKIIRLNTLSSTNDFLQDMLRKNPAEEEGLVVTAEEQTAGKGTGTNSWESEKGKNLIVSLILRPCFLNPEHQFELNKCIALAVQQVVAGLVKQEKVCIKWPNDIYIGDRKVAGILISNSILGQQIEYSVVGIGINVNQVVFTSGAPNPVSLISFLKKDLTVGECLDLLIENLEKFYSMLKNLEFRNIHQSYIQSLYRLNETHQFYYRGNKITATISGISAMGKLMLSTSEQTLLECEMNEIKYLRD